MSSASRCLPSSSVAGMSRIATNQLHIVSNKDDADSATAAAPVVHSSDGGSLSSSSSSSPASAQLTAPPPSPVHSSSTVPSSPFSSSQQTAFFATPPPSSSFSTASSASSSLSSSPLHRPSPSSAHIPPLLPYYDDEVKQPSSSLLPSASASSSASTLRDHKDGEAWQDGGEKGFHGKEGRGAAQAEEEKRDLLAGKAAAQWSYGASLKEQERQARQAEREQAMTVEHRKAAAEEEKYASEQHKLLHLLITMYRCRECLPTWKDREEQRLGIETNEYASRRLGEFCCVGHALSASFPPCLPLDLLPLTQGYLLNQPTRSFLTHPPPPSAGVIQWSATAQAPH